MRRKLLLPGLIVAVAVIAFGAYNLVALVAHDQTRENVRLDGIDTIDIELSAGSVKLVGAPGTGVNGDRVVDSGLRAPRYSETVNGSTLTLRANCPVFSGFRCKVRYELTVPAGVRVTGHNSGGGIEIDGVNGTVDVSSSGGGIDLTRTGGAVKASSSGGGINASGASGSLDLDSSGGGIKVTDGRGDQVIARSSGGGVTVQMVVDPTNIDASSSGGGVTVNVPNDGQGYAVDAHSSGGDTKVSVNTNSQSPRRIRADSSGGGVTVAYR